VDEMIRSMLDPIGRPRTLKPVEAAEPASRRRSTPAKRAARRGRAEPPVD
jgi:hypothetical protein